MEHGACGAIIRQVPEPRLLSFLSLFFPFPRCFSFFVALLLFLSLWPPAPRPPLPTAHARPGTRSAHRTPFPRRGKGHSPWSEWGGPGLRRRSCRLPGAARGLGSAGSGRGEGLGSGWGWAGGAPCPWRKVGQAGWGAEVGARAGRGGSRGTVSGVGGWLQPCDSSSDGDQGTRPWCTRPVAGLSQNT